MIADDTTFRYRLVWLDQGTITPTQPVPQHVQVIVGEMGPGDAVILGLEGYANVTNVPKLGLSCVAGTLIPPQMVTLQPELSMTALTNASVTSFFRDTATQTLWLKIMEASSIPIEDDGRGQIILLDF